MREIWKFPLGQWGGVQELEVPGSTKFISAIKQYDKPTLYAIVDPTIDRITTKVWVVQTGTAFDSNLLTTHCFLGTVDFDDGDYILHVFVEKTVSYL